MSNISKLLARYLFAFCWINKFSKEILFNILLNKNEAFNCECLFGMSTLAFDRIVMTNNKAEFRSWR
jgi:hypothetical protein